MHKGFRRALLLSVSSLAVFGGAAYAADSTAPATVDEVIVTGTANPSGLQRLDAGFSITTASADKISEVAPTSTANLLKIVPGVFAETTGGTAGANIEVRGFPTGGDAQFVTIQLDGSPVFAVPTLSFLENSSIFRIDDTVKRVEVLRGGPAPIYSNGQAGATLNFIQKNGKTDEGGSLRATVGTANLYRLDAYYGGQIADGWYASIGGFYRTASGVRDPGFPADRGGQVVATLTRDLENGSITLYGRKLHDDNAFYTSIPLISRNGGEDIDEFPGFDALTGSLLGNELRSFTFQTTPGPVPLTQTRDFTRGRGADVTLLGIDYHQDFNGWSISNKANYTEGDTPTYALFNGPATTTVGQFIADQVTAANANAAVVAAAGGVATGGTAAFTNGGGGISLDTQIIPIGAWVVDKRIRSFTDDFRVSREIFTGNTLTAGAYYADYWADDRWFLGNTVLLTVQHHGRLVDVTLDNGVRPTQLGHVGSSFFSLNANWSGRNIAGFIADEWNLTDKLKLDAGIRVENQRVTGAIENNSTQDLDNNPLTLFNNTASVLNGTFTTVDFNKSHGSWTAGLNYRFAENLSAFARVNSGFRFPSFDDLRSNLSGTEKIKQYEVGLKTAGSWYAGNLTLFGNTFRGSPFGVILSDGTMVNTTLASDSYGLEFEGEVRPTEHLALELSGNWQRSRYVDAVNDGNQTQRQPEFQARFTPSYTVPFNWGDVKAFLAWTYVGKRFADVQNQQILPSYDTLDIGLEANIGERWTVLLTGTNVTDTLAITEGNSRVLGSGLAGGVFQGRPLFGHEYQLSARVRF